MSGADSTTEVTPTGRYEARSLCLVREIRGQIFSVVGTGVAILPSFSVVIGHLGISNLKLSQI